MLPCLSVFRMLHQIILYHIDVFLHISNVLNIVHFVNICFSPDFFHFNLLLFNEVIVLDGCEMMDAKRIWTHDLYPLSSW
jgi:hypothetical protein